MDINSIACISFTFSIVCLLAILVDAIKFSQRMWSMNIVWPITALYSGPLGLWAYYKIDRKSVKKGSGGMPMDHGQKPYWQSKQSALNDHNRERNMW